MDSESKEMFQKILDRLDKIDGRLDKMENHLGKVDSRLDKMENHLGKVDSRLDRLESGQAEIKREFYKIDRKIIDVYNLALDAWGLGAENKEWLEGKKLKA